jgi:hypothetical protein
MDIPDRTPHAPEPPPGPSPPPRWIERATSPPPDPGEAVTTPRRIVAQEARLLLAGAVGVVAATIESEARRLAHQAAALRAEVAR